MRERLVDVLNSVGNVVHTYPITLANSNREPDDSDFQAKALDAACFGRLVPSDEIPRLKTRMHVNRDGPVEPYGDKVPVMSETQLNMNHLIRERAYYLWQNSVEKSTSDDNWLRARQEHLEKRAYRLWEREGRPTNRADEFWFRTQAFESC